MHTDGAAWLLTCQRSSHQSSAANPGPQRALPAVEDSLSPEHLHRPDEIFPGHKTALKDYAW
jgi:hypothetical protein